METTVVIVGGGPTGLAVAACLGLSSVPYILLERDDCSAPLWRKRCYDRLHLHLPKEICQLPHMPHPNSTPLFIPKDRFIGYLDDYAARFSVRPLLRREVVSATHDAGAGKWRVAARVGESGEVENYTCRFLVVASGENDVPFLPDIPGLDTFSGDVVHSSLYRNADDYAGKRVLVVGAGNSGMEIACDLAEHGADAVSIVVRSPVHIVTKVIWMIGLALSRVLAIRWVDRVVLLLCYIRFGDLSRYGIRRPEKGPFYLKLNTPIYPVLDVGTADKIKSGKVKVLPSIKTIHKGSIMFEDGRNCSFDSIILATGYRSIARQWLQDEGDLIGDNGMAKNNFPNHWKGSKGLYCAGLVRRGFYGSSEDATNIARDISAKLARRN